MSGRARRSGSRIRIGGGVSIECNAGEWRGRELELSVGLGCWAVLALGVLVAHLQAKHIGRGSSASPAQGLATSHGKIQTNLRIPLTA